MPYVMMCEGWADSSRCEYKGQFLQWYYPDNPASQPLAQWTPELRKARQFKDVGELLECWKQVRSSDLIRPDGKPNRPLTAFSVSSKQVA